jgi:hypothetical protein
MEKPADAVVAVNGRLTNGTIELAEQLQTLAAM